MKKKLLYLVHRLPYPPNKGDKISSFNLLRFVAERYDVHLGSFIDSPDDRRYAVKMREFCADVCLVELDPRRARLASLRGLLSGEALTLPYYRSARLRRWIERTLRDARPDAILVYSGALAQYLPVAGLPRTVLIFDDVDSQKWRQFAPGKPWPLSWLYRREGERLLTFERRMAALSDACVFISDAEAALFRSLAPEVADRIYARRQGVDSGYFDPDRDYPNPYPDGVRPLSFTGLMDYWPNVEAVTWFCDAVLPSVRAAVPGTVFYIVGMNPTAAVRKLAERDGVEVTGKVPDVRPYLAHAAAVVAPLRIARGVQNKVLEALAMARPVVATDDALAGIDAGTACHARAAGDAAALSAALIEVLTGGLSANPAARASVLERYNWDTNLQQIHTLLEGTSARQRGRP